ncbi:acyltransferase family protein [Brytella acorum]|uniref:Heparan-alpha-glucosaminide N-acetyltransferase domain-containing protein n=1 Tax=Brytella acorum TaxID=2959299 RepID=A0AA35UQW1_9PROT|nr:DUF5009 domain-containing protein [Brytella acorum]MDF3625147.1 heparan-alpha-glucosaminide N-acetyltransferase domain-containing protein [Brytella acorum]CAI9122047.1 heparan-alpha-glucosaminide N-acetyltransferase domain-containing protein [Brytella acorum]
MTIDEGVAVPQAVPHRRIVSVDALRGLTVAVMIVVNDPGDWAHVYAPLLHAAWNGFTLADFVFPTFLFLVGCSIPLALDRRVARGDSRSMLSWHIARRAGILFALEILLGLYPHFTLHHLAHFRFYGVLTRIVICYLTVGLLVVWVPRPKAMPLLGAFLLVGYWVLMRYVPVPGLGTPGTSFPLFDPERNLAAWMDRGITDWSQAWLHTGRLYEGRWDPEGLLSTLPALATTILGVITGRFLRRGSASAPSALAVSGLIALAAGACWAPFFPINKSLWSSSYVLWSAGWGLLLLAFFHQIFDGARLHEKSRLAAGLLRPMQIFGTNALVAYMFSGFLIETFIALPAPSGPSDSLLSWIYAFFAVPVSTKATSLAFALVFAAACFVPEWMLWRRRMIVKL